MVIVVPAWLHTTINPLSGKTVSLAKLEVCQDNQGVSIDKKRRGEMPGGLTGQFLTRNNNQAVREGSLLLCRNGIFIKRLMIMTESGRQRQ